MTPEFVVGQPYFFLSFADEDFRIPLIESYIYIGRDLEPGSPDGSRWFFQDPESYLRKGAYRPREEDTEIPLDRIRDVGEAESTMHVHSFSEDAAGALLTLEQLARQLLEHSRGGGGK